MNIGQTVYAAICKSAELGERVTKVVLPEKLYEEFITEPGMARMMKTLGVEVVSGKVKVPKFLKGVQK
jgi:hypothetical protein